MDRKQALITLGAALGIGIALYILGLVVFPEAPYAFINLVGLAPVIAVPVAGGFHFAGWLLGVSFFGGWFFPFVRRLCWFLRDLAWALVRFCYSGLLALIGGLSRTPEVKTPTVRPTREMPKPPGANEQRKATAQATAPQLEQSTTNRIKGFIAQRKEK